MGGRRVPNPPKPRKFDLNADEFLAAVTGELTAAELGVYWMLCLLMYNRCESIKYDMEWLRRKFKPNPGSKWIEPIVKKLISKGKVRLEGHSLVVDRVLDEILLSRSRILAASLRGRSGGSVSKKTNGLDEARARGSTSTTTTTYDKGETLTLLPAESDSSLPNQTIRQIANLTRSLGSDFETWWKAYPHKVGKPAARPKFDKARKTASLQELLDGVKRYVANKPGDRPWCNPATWLHQGRWADEEAKPNGANGHIKLFSERDRPSTPPPSPGQRQGRPGQKPPLH
jgi:hypothetical protein